MTDSEVTMQDTFSFLINGIQRSEQSGCITFSAKLRSTR